MRFSARLQRTLVLLVVCALSFGILPGLSAQGDKKDIFILGRSQDAVNLDPAQITYNIDIWIINNVFDQLVRVNPTDNSLEPDLATSWVISPDKKTYTFTLRDGVKFSDGTPVTADDVKWSLDRARNPDTSSFFNFSLSPIALITAPDEKTVVISLTDPSSAFLAPLAMFNASIAPQAYFEKVGADAFASAPVGSGAYIVKEWDKGTSLTLEANPNYWGDAPLTKTIKLVSIPDDNTRVLQLQSGDIDAAESVPLSRVTELQSDPNVTIDLFPSTFVQSFLMNTRTEPFNDLNARLALAYATDYEALNKVINFGIGTVANSFMSSATPLYDKNAVAPTFDLAKAKDALSKSKYPTGFSFTFTIVGDDQTSNQLATALQQMYAQIGVTMNIEQVDQGVRDDKYNNADFQALVSYWSDDMVDPDEVTTYMAYYPSSGSMQSGFNDDATNKLVLAARTETDPARRAQMYSTIQQTINDQVPFITLYYKPFAVGVSHKVHDLVQLSLGNYLFSKVSVDN